MNLETREHNYILKHWNGELSLVKSYWVNGVLLNILLVFIISWITYDLNIAESPTFVAYVLISIWITLCLITVWQLVGVWRSADNYSKKSKKSWGTVAKFFTVLAFLGFIGEFSSSALPQIKAYWQIASGKDPISSYKLRVLRDSTELEFSGDIGFGAEKKVLEYLNSHPSITIIHLNSNGGRITVARELAKIIEDKGLSTYTSLGCFSACVLPYAAGKERMISKDAKLGFHQYDFAGFDQSDFQADYLIDKRFLINRGISPDFIKRIFNTPSDDMWFPTHEDLFKASFITKYPNLDDVAISNITDFNQEKFEEILNELPIYGALRESDPEVYTKILEALKIAIERGHSLAEVRQITMPLLIEVLYKKLPQTSGEALMEFAIVMVQQLKFLEKTDPYTCYAYAMGDPEVYNYISFSDELQMMEQNAMAKVIRGYSLFTEIPSEREVEVELEQIFITLARNHGDGMNLLLEQTHSRDQQPAHCRIMIDYFSEILNQEPAKAVKVLRYIFA